MIGPWKLSFLAHLLCNLLGKLRTKAERMDSVGEEVATLNRGIKKIVQVVDVHVAVAETSSGSNMEIADHFVDTNASLNAASFVSLGIQALCVVFTLALLHILTTSERPGHTRICLSNFIASITTASFLCVRWRVCAVTATAIVGIQMWSFFVPEYD